jgi:hypothetical protein
MSRINTYKFQKELLKKTSDRREYMVREQIQNYQYEVRYFPELGGQRAILHPLREKKYEELQGSRGIAPNNTKTRKDLLEKVKREIKDLKQDDYDRAYEISDYVNVVKDVDKVVEIGFRIPMTLELYKHLDCKTFGYDVVDFNVKVAKDLGYNCKKMDLSDYGNQNLEELKDADLIVCYHVVEHVSRPDLAIRDIYNNMKTNAILHIEVPIEPYRYPNIDSGHMFTFHRYDLAKFLRATGFELCGEPKVTHDYERYLVYKKGD